VTGTVENISLNNDKAKDIKVGPIGGVFEKVYGAKKWGMKRVIIPKENYDNTYFDRFSGGVTVKSADTVLQYFDLMRADIPRKTLIKEGKDEYTLAD